MLNYAAPSIRRCWEKRLSPSLQQADTLSLRFEEEEGEVWQWVAADRTFAEPSIIDLRTAPDPHRAATERMQADLAQDLRVDGGNPLVCHQLLRVGDDRWYWYQRYHHLLVDGFSFPAITRQIAAIYRAWQRGEATPESPFTPFAEVVDEYQRYAGSEAWQRDKAFWQAQRQALPAPASLSAAPLGGRAAGSDIWRMKLEMNADAFRRLASHAPQCQPADLALALTTLWLGRLCNRMDYAAGFIFMRRMGSAALTSTGPVLNVLPLAVHIDARETLADLAMRLAAQLKKMRRHQRYDAEQIVRDSGKAAGDEPLFGPVLNVKVFDYQLDIDGVQAVTHTLATGPVNDLELALFPDETGGLSLEILANKARYDEAELRRHMARLTALLAQFAADPALRCGEAEMLSADELARLAAVNDTAVPLPATTLSALVADQARKTPDALGAGGRPLAVQLSRDASAGGGARAAAASARREAGRQRGGGPAALGVPDPGAARHCRSGGRLAAAGHRLPGRPPADDAGRRPAVAADRHGGPAGPLQRYSGAGKPLLPAAAGRRG